MKAFLWYGLDKVSNCFHEEGSVLIEAETIERAREMANESCIRDVSKEPNAIFESNSKKEKMWIFPDAGCC